MESVAAYAAASPSTSNSSSTDINAKEWDTQDVVFWLKANNLGEFTKGFEEQQIDGMCLVEGLSETELNACRVLTVGKKRLLQRKISELVDHSKKSVPRLKRTKLVKTLSPAQKEDLLRRKRRVHQKTVAAFKGNKIPVIRGNPNAKRKFDELVEDCSGLLNDDIGYDKEELQRHVRAILDERRRMVREGYNYEEGNSTDTDGPDNKKPKGETNEVEEDTSDSNSSEDEFKLPGGATKVPLSTAETIILVYFKKAYTKEVKKDLLISLCKELNIKNVKAKDKNELMMIVAQELLQKKKVFLKEDSDFFCLHRESVGISP